MRNSLPITVKITGGQGVAILVESSDVYRPVAMFAPAGGLGGIVPAVKRHGIFAARTFYVHTGQVQPGVIFLKDFPAGITRGKPFSVFHFSSVNSY